MREANPLRGEVLLPLGEGRVLRPTFHALVMAEAELGSLLKMVERAAEGDVRLQEMAGLFWHCLPEEREERPVFEASLLEIGISALLPVYKKLLARLFGGE